MISTVIAKPTRECNASCSYCSAPPESGEHWSFYDFQRYFDRVKPALSDNCNWIWHGGEPTLLPPSFYVACHDYAKRHLPGIRFCIQSNLLNYSSKRWKKVFHTIFGGRVSTSFDPSSEERILSGSSELYTKTFKARLQQVICDGMKPLVITVIGKDDSSLVREYAYAAIDENLIDIRLNYMYPAGRAFNEDSIITPDDYGDLLIDVFDKWIDAGGRNEFVPVSQMLDAVTRRHVNRCPWTRDCASGFLSITPIGDVYTCGTLTDLGDESLKYGNLNDIGDDPLELQYGIHRLLASEAATTVRARKYKLPKDCLACEHFQECQGGCQRDAALYGRGLGGKYYYCGSWKKVFSHIKHRINAGHLNDVISRRRLGVSV